MVFRLDRNTPSFSHFIMQQTTVRQCHKMTCLTLCYVFVMHTRNDCGKWMRTTFGPQAPHANFHCPPVPWPLPPHCPPASDSWCRPCILHISPHHSPCLHSHYLSLSPDFLLKLIFSSVVSWFLLESGLPLRNLDSTRTYCALAYLCHFLLVCV